MNVFFNKNKMEIRFFRTSSGNEPVRKWLKKLTEKEKKTIGTDLKTIELSWPIGMPLVKHLDNGIWEVRTNLPAGKISRVIFFIHKKYIILLHGFIKKTQKTPAKELSLAKKRKLLFEKHEV